MVTLYCNIRNIRHKTAKMRLKNARINGSPKRKAYKESVLKFSLWVFVLRLKMVCALQVENVLHVTNEWCQGFSTNEQSSKGFMISHAAWVNDNQCDQIW